MKRRNATRSALFTSIISLLLCVSMLVGTTFAWFTDEVTSAGNIIKSGTLDVELYWADGTKAVPTDAAGWTDASKGAIFNYTLWEPGYTEVRHIKIANEGTLALKYQLMIRANGEVSELADVIDVYFTDPAAQIADRTDLVAATPVGTLSKVLATMPKSTSGTLLAGKEATVTLALKMQESAGNEYQDLAIGTNFSVVLVATQLEAENDSFDNTYDEDAWGEGFAVVTAQDLQAAINNGETEIDLMADIEAAESIVIPNGATVALNLNGKTISNETDYVFESQGDLTISGEGNIAGMGGIRATAGNLTINGGNYFASSDWSKGTYQHTIKAVNATVVINDGNFDATVNGQTNAMFNASENATITINGGNFKNVAGELNQFDPYIFTYEKNGKVIINDGTFYGGWRFNGETATTDIYGGNFTVGFDGQSFHANSTHKVTVYGGTFETQAYEKLTTKLNDIVAPGFKAVKVGSTYYVVAENVAGVVTEPKALKDALTAAGTAGAGDTTIAFFGDIDMTNTAWTPIKVDGYHGADIVTIEGNGATITGLTAPLFAGGFAGGSGIVIKDLTIADSNIVSTNTVGSGAFIESVDSMALITLENCHLVNSTVTGGNGSRTGGLIGWTAGYNNVNDGPVKTYVTIKDCSVIRCTITCDGSVGGIYGHAGNNAWTYSTVENCVVKDNVLNSTDDGAWRVGVVVGTANVGELTINNITESGNTLTQTGKTAPAGQSNLYGRFVPGNTGKLVIDGASVVTTAGELSTAVANGKVSLNQDIDLGKIDLTGAITNDVVIDANGHKITTTDAYGIEATPGKNITISNADVVMTKKGDYITYAAGFKIANGDYAGATITLQNCTITMANTDWAYAVNMPAGVKNLNLVIDNCTLEGAVAVQCWGDNNNITITNSELICNYTTSEMYTSYCVSLQSDGSNVSENNTLVIEDCEFKYSGIDNFNSSIYSAKDYGTGNIVSVTNCTYDAKVVK